ncbi:hypothetical protein AC629_27620 [Bradyrhizobium sp. NAS80.1]|nr:hypothetical protein AC629_27620 [Bradyrhizobium sp. NAS80.1]
MAVPVCARKAHAQGLVEARTDRVLWCLVLDRHRRIHTVMAGLVPAIHVLPRPKNVDTRDIGERKRRRPSDGYARA